MATATVTSKGQVVIPSALRAKYGIKKGTKITFLEEADGMLLIKTRELLRKGKGMLKTEGKSLMDMLYEEKEIERNR